MLGILLVAIILIQRGKGSDAGMAFGAGASGTVFGAAGSGTFLTKTTKWLFIGFICTSLALAYVYNNQKPVTSILDTVEEVQEEGDSLPVASPLPGDVDPDNVMNTLPEVSGTTADGAIVTAQPVETPETAAESSESEVEPVADVPDSE